MTEISDVRQGWKFMEQILGASFGAEIAHSEFLYNLSENNRIDNDNQLIEQINAAIDQLQKNIQEHDYLNLPIEQLKGYMAEEWHAGTYNIDAISNQSEYYAKVLHENTSGSVDVQVRHDVGTHRFEVDKNYSLKYSNEASASENMQAALSPSSSIAKYDGQDRLIPGEQVENAKEWADKRIASNATRRPHVAAAHLQTKEHLVGKVSYGGNESKELSVEESKQIAREAKDGSFDPSKHGIEKSKLLDEYQTDYFSKAMQAGLTAAMITAITQIVPELYKSIDYLIKNGQIDLNQVAKSSGKIITSSGESFLRGSVAYGIKAAIDNGLFGEAAQNISPGVIGALVTITLGTLKNSIYVAAGKMTPREMGMKFIDTAVVSTGFIVGGAIGQAIAPELPVVAYAIGSLIGCSVSVVYNIGKKKLISFCIDTGFTCFGLVEQNYELPESVLKQLGIDTISVGRNKVEQTEISRTNVFDSVDKHQYETIDMTMLKRGLIGVNKIGYILK